MRPIPVVLLDEGVEARLLLEHIRRGGFGGFLLQGQVHPLVPAVLLGMARLGRFALQGQVHPLVPAILLRMAWLDPFDLNAQAEPPDGEFAQAVEGRRAKRTPLSVRMAVGSPDTPASNEQWSPRSAPAADWLGDTVAGCDR